MAFLPPAVMSPLTIFSFSVMHVYLFISCQALYTEHVCVLAAALLVFLIGFHFLLFVYITEVSPCALGSSRG